MLLISCGVLTSREIVLDRLTLLPVFCFASGRSKSLRDSLKVSAVLVVLESRYSSQIRFGLAVRKRVDHLL